MRKRAKKVKENRFYLGSDGRSPLLYRLERVLDLVESALGREDRNVIVILIFEHPLSPSL